MIEMCTRGRESLGPADRADLTGHPEAIEVLPSGRQTIDFHVHRVGELGNGEDLAASNHPSEAAVQPDFPLDRNLHWRHATT
jgi:hypothetical protein